MQLGAGGVGFGGGVFGGGGSLVKTDAMAVENNVGGGGGSGGGGGALVGGAIVGGAGMAGRPLVPLAPMASPLDEVGCLDVSFGVVGSQVRSHRQNLTVIF